MSTYVIAYLAAIVIANLTTAHFGKLATIPNAAILIAFDLTSRDKLHEAWHHRNLWPKMAALIAAGSLLSYALNQTAGPIARASLIAFAAAAATDALIYHRLFNRHRLLRINGSNVPSALVDSIAFPTLAFGSFDPFITAGQFAAKTIGGFFWSLFLK